MAYISEPSARLEVLNDIKDRMHCGVPFVVNPNDRGYSTLRQAVRDAAMTAETAARLVGVEPRHFRRLVEQPAFRRLHWAVMEVGNFTFYDRIAVDWLAKYHRVAKTRKSLKKHGISAYRIRVLTERLDRRKFEYYSSSDFFGLRKNDCNATVENLIRHVGYRFDDPCELRELSFLEAFGPDDGPENDEEYPQYLEMQEKLYAESNSLSPPIPL